MTRRDEINIIVRKHLVDELHVVCARVKTEGVFNSRTNDHLIAIKIIVKEIEDYRKEFDDIINKK